MQPNNPQQPNLTNPASVRPRAQFFDVVRPGRTPASPNARPVLNSNRPPVPDNSMKMGAPAVPPGFMNQPKPVAPPPPPPTLQPAPAPPPPRPQPTPPVQPFRPAASSPRPSFTPPRPAPQHMGQAAIDGQMGPSEQVFGPSQVQQKAIHQKHSIWSEVIAVIAIIALVVIIINILLDADIINLPLPHTNFFEY